MKQSHKLIRGGRARVVSASILILLSAFSALQVVLSGLANGAIYGLPSKLAEAIEMRRRVVLFSWSCLLLQGLIVAVLAPLFPLREVELDSSSAPKILTRYLPAVGISLVGTGVALGLIVWVIRMFA
jgi:hypothetical protein